MSQTSSSLRHPADDKMAFKFPPGSVVEIQGLQNNVELNGTLGVAKRHVVDEGRLEVMIAGRSDTIAIKPSNLIMPQGLASSEDERCCCYQHAVFWPKVQGGTIPMYAFEDCPSGWSTMDFIGDKLHWKKPTCLGGIESRGVAKPDFVMYFDAADEISAINDVAMSIVKRLPDHELSKVSGALLRGRPIRGVCALHYSPMKSTLFSSHMPSQVITSGDPNRHFSMKELRDVLNFQESEEGRAQYEAHDNPFHRVYGARAS